MNEYLDISSINDISSLEYNVIYYFSFALIKFKDKIFFNVFKRKKKKSQNKRGIRKKK
jgi:hypothetical protein